MRNVKIGIIGSGFGLYGHLPAFHSIKNCKVVAVCAKNSERLSEYYYSLGLKKTYSDWREMLEKEDLDAISIAVPPFIQYKIAKEAIQKGIHVFLEKPLADTLRHANELYELAKKHNVIHAVDFIFPEIDEWKVMKQLIDKNKYGRLRHISVNWDFQSYDIKHGISSWKTDISKGGGALNFYFCHSLYYLEYFAGEIKQIKSIFGYSPKSKNGAETNVDLVFEFKNKLKGSGHISCITPGLNRHQLIFKCDNATIMLENKDSFVRNFKITIFTEKGQKVLVSKKKQTADDQKARSEIVQKLASRFISSCIKKKQMTPSIKEGLRVQQLIGKIKKQNL